MAPNPRGPKAARTIGREEPDPRVPERQAPTAPIRDNVIRNRAGEPVTLRLTGDEDKFDLARMGIFPPPGWDYQWKVKYVKGQEMREAQVEQAANGWEPVPASRHDGKCMPRGWQGHIERGGMVLMERDERLTLQARKLEKRAADKALAQSHVMADLMGPDSLADFDNPNTRVSIKSNRDAITVTNKSEYSVDE